LALGKERSSEGQVPKWREKGLKCDLHHFPFSYIIERREAGSSQPRGKERPIGRHHFMTGREEEEELGYCDSVDEDGNTERGGKAEKKE